MKSYVYIRTVIQVANAAELYGAVELCAPEMTLLMFFRRIVPGFELLRC
jgi:hypothetical protein